jgi:hypothetical protein
MIAGCRLLRSQFVLEMFRMPATLLLHPKRDVVALWSFD